MTSTREYLENKLAQIKGITIDTWKDTDLVCLFFNGKEFAHFHGENILDIRLSQKIIKVEGLSRDVTQDIHPNRSPNSIWIGIKFSNEEEVDHLIHLVKLAINL